jgi:hypothetical protein
MYLHIAPTRLISEIQQEFNRKFNFLKLEFFTRRGFVNSDYSSTQIAPSNRRIGDIQQVITEGEIEIEGEMKVKELEQRLKEEFSVAAQVFRRSGNLWLETTMTDNWTLNQQNKHGKEISTGSGYEKETEDYDLTRDADH